MPQGNYDHPSYLTRAFFGPLTTVAGANGTSLSFVAPQDIQIRGLSATVVTAGTSAGAGNSVFILSGTTSVTNSSVSLGTNTAGSAGVATTVDLNTKVSKGGLISLKNGTDATGVARVTIEYNIAPDTGVWS